MHSPNFALNDNHLFLEELASRESCENLLKKVFTVYINQGTLRRKRIRFFVSLCSFSNINAKSESQKAVVGSSKVWRIHRAQIVFDHYSYMESKHCHVTKSPCLFLVVFHMTFRLAHSTYITPVWLHHTQSMTFER